LVAERQHGDDVDDRERDREAGVLQPFLARLRQRGHPRRQPRNLAVHVPIVRSAPPPRIGTRDEAAGRPNGLGAAPPEAGSTPWGVATQSAPRPIRKALRASHHDHMNAYDPVTTIAHAATPNETPPRTPRLGIGLIAAAAIGLELAVSGRYGYVRDELYFFGAGHPLAFRYVDPPALAPPLPPVSAPLDAPS